MDRIESLFKHTHSGFHTGCHAYKEVVLAFMGFPFKNRHTDDENIETYNRINSKYEWFSFHIHVLCIHVHKFSSQSYSKFIYRP